MHQHINKIQEIITTKYPAGFAESFVRIVGMKDYLYWEKIAKKFDVPELLVEYYTWLSKTPLRDTSNYDRYGLYEDPFLPLEKDEAKDVTEEAIDNMQFNDLDGNKTGGFKKGFVIIAKWANAAYLVIDTKGEVAEKGSVIEMDLDYGNIPEKYYVRFASFEKYLETVAALSSDMALESYVHAVDMKNKISFSETEGKLKQCREKQAKIEFSLNPGQYAIDWKTGERLEWNVEAG